MPIWGREHNANNYVSDDIVALYGHETPEGLREIREAYRQWQMGPSVFAQLGRLIEDPQGQGQGQVDWKREGF